MTGIGINNMSKSYQEFSDDISMQRITRTVETFKHGMAVSDYTMRDIHKSTHFHGLKWETFYDELGQRMILELQAKIASKKFAVKTVRLPDGWWQAIRHAVSQSGWMMYQCVRAWFAKHPVRYVEVTMEANAYHPDVAIPDHETFVDIAYRVRASGRFE